MASVRFNRSKSHYQHLDRIEMQVFNDFIFFQSGAEVVRPLPLVAPPSSLVDCRELVLVRLRLRSGDTRSRARVFPSIILLASN